jgi:hypothetical protein
MKKLRLKGKGHEFQDVARLLNFYQLWLDDLYPRAKFADGLQLIEKVGHTKRMQVMRKAWIDERKPGYIAPGSELVEGILNGESVNSILHKEAAETAQADHNGLPTQTLMEDEDKVPDDDAMFFASPSKNRPADQPMEGGDPDDDELDALMAMQSNSAPTKPAKTLPEAEEDDDLDALLAEQDSRANTGIPVVSSHTPDDDEEDDLDALLAEQETRNIPVTTTILPQPTSSSRPPSRDSTSKSRKRQTIFDDSESEGDDDTHTALDTHQSRDQKSTPPTSPLPTAQEADTEPSLPQVAKDVRERLKEGSQEEIAVTFSSSPIRNSSQKDGYKVYSSSPLPNNPEEEDLDALLGDGM